MEIPKHKTYSQIEERINQKKHLINNYVKKYNLSDDKDQKKKLMDIIQKHEKELLILQNENK